MDMDGIVTRSSLRRRLNSIDMEKPVTPTRRSTRGEKFRQSMTPEKFDFYGFHTNKSAVEVISSPGLPLTPLRKTRRNSIDINDVVYSSKSKAAKSLINDVVIEENEQLVKDQLVNSYKNDNLQIVNLSTNESLKNDKCEDNLSKNMSLRERNNLSANVINSFNINKSKEDDNISINSFKKNCNCEHENHVTTCADRDNHSGYSLSNNDLKDITTNTNDKILQEKTNTNVSNINSFMEMESCSPIKLINVETSMKSECEVTEIKFKSVTFEDSVSKSEKEKKRFYKTPNTNKNKKNSKIKEITNFVKNLEESSPQKLSLNDNSSNKGQNELIFEDKNEDESFIRNTPHKILINNKLTCSTPLNVHRNEDNLKKTDIILSQYRSQKLIKRDNEHLSKSWPDHNKSFTNNFIHLSIQEKHATNDQEHLNKQKTIRDSGKKNENNNTDETPNLSKAEKHIFTENRDFDEVVVLGNSFATETSCNISKYNMNENQDVVSPRSLEKVRTAKIVELKNGTSSEESFSLFISSMQEKFTTNDSSILLNKPTKRDQVDPHKEEKLNNLSDNAKENKGIEENTENLLENSTITETTRNIFDDTDSIGLEDNTENLLKNSLLTETTRNISKDTDCKKKTVFLSNRLEEITATKIHTLLDETSSESSHPIATSGNISKDSDCIGNTIETVFSSKCLEEIIATKIDTMTVDISSGDDAFSHKEIKLEQNSNKSVLPHLNNYDLEFSEFEDVVKNFISIQNINEAINTKKENEKVQKLQEENKTAEIDKFKNNSAMNTENLNEVVENAEHHNQNATKKSANTRTEEEEKTKYDVCKANTDISFILQKCNEILNVANKEKLMEKLKRNNKIKTKKLHSNCSENMGKIVVKAGRVEKRKTEKAILQAKIQARTELNPNKNTNIKADKNKKTEYVSEDILKAISNNIDKSIEKDKVLEDQDNGIKINHFMKSKEKLNTKQLNDRKIKLMNTQGIISTPSGLFVEEPYSPVKKCIKKYNLPTGTVIEEPISPVMSNRLGFIETPITPKGFKVKNILGDFKIPELKLTNKKRKRKLMVDSDALEAVNTVWTSAGPFVEEICKPVYKTVNNSSTKFCAVPLNLKTIKKNFGHGIINEKVLEFKKKSLLETDSCRETSKQLLQRKERKKFYNKY